MAAASIAATRVSRTRIQGIDTARALAIALAMMAHAFIHFGIWELLSDTAVLVLRSFVRMATPTFIILFGMMLEIVYLKMIRRSERQACWVRLVTRAIQCYLLYLCVAAAGVVGGNLTAAEGVKAALFLDNAYFANILKFYSLGLVCGIALLELRARYGLRAVAAAAAGIWLAWPLIKALPPLPPSIAHLASFLIGAGAETGPSVLQGMTLAALGLVLGYVFSGLRAEEPARRRDARRLLSLVALVVLAPAATLFMLTGFRPTLESFTDYSVRAANHPLYYLVGSAFSLLLIAGCIAAARRLPAGLLARLNVFGVSSLFAYGVGNVILNLLPTSRGDLALGLGASAAFLAGLYGLTVYFQRAVRVQVSEAPHRSLAARLGAMHDRLRQHTARLAALFVGQLLAWAKAV